MKMEQDINLTGCTVVKNEDDRIVLKCDDVNILRGIIRQVRIAREIYKERIRTVLARPLSQLTIEKY